jgi:hypothetical protein
VVEPEEVGQLDMPAGFFERLAQRGSEQRFMLLEMACGLVEYRLSCIHAIDGFLHHQEQAVFFDDRGDGAVGEPGHRALGR